MSTVETERLDSMGRGDGYSNHDSSRLILSSLVVLAGEKQRLMRSLVISVILGVLLAFLLPVRYTAYTSILPPAQNSSLSSLLTSQFGGLGPLAALGSGLGVKNPGDMYASMLRSRSVEDAVIKRYGLMQEYREKTLSETRKKFEKRTTVALGVKDGIIRISVEDADPNKAAEMANGYVDEFRRLTNGLALTEASQRRVFFEQQLLAAKNDLAAAEEALKTTQQKTGIIQLDGQAKAMIESAASIRAQVAAKQVQITAMRTYAANDNPELQLAQQQLAALETQLARLTGAQQASSDLFVPKGRVPEAGLEYVRRLRDVKYNETMFEMLASQLEIAKIDEAKQGALIQVIDRAIVPDKRSFPKRLLVVILTILVVAFVHTMWIFARNRYNRAAQDPNTQLQIENLKALLRR